MPTHSTDSTSFVLSHSTPYRVLLYPLTASKLISSHSPSSSSAFSPLLLNAPLHHAAYAAAIVLDSADTRQ